MAKITNLLRLQIADQLESYIAQNYLKANDKLPSERELAERWNVNRMTLRRAIEKLTDEGVLYSVRGSGTYVAPKKIIRNLGVFRSFTETMKELNLSFQTELLSIQKVEANKELAKIFSIYLGTEIIEIQRKRIVEGIPYSIETSYLPYELCKGIENLDLASHSLYELLKAHYEIHLASQKQKISSVDISGRQSALLDLKGSDPVLLISSTSFDKEEMVVEYTKELVRYDRCVITSISREKEDNI